jgi:formylmethanofuran dehydrogenase subunit B
VDALLIVGSSGLAGPRLSALLGRAPAIVIGPRASEAAFAAVAVDTAVAGIQEAGTALRMDDVPLPLGAPLSGPPSTADVVAALGRRLAESSVAPAAGNRQ